MPIPVLKFLIQYKLTGSSKLHRAYVIAYSKKDAFIKFLKSKKQDNITSLEILGDPIPNNKAIRVAYYKKYKKC